MEIWLVRSVALGLPLGTVGALTRRRGPVGVLAGLVVPVGVVVNMAVLPPQQDSPMARPVVGAVWLAAALMTVLVLTRSRQSPAEEPQRR